MWREILVAKDGRWQLQRMALAKGEGVAVAVAKVVKDEISMKEAVAKRWRRRWQWRKKRWQQRKM